MEKPTRNRLERALNAIEARLDEPLELADIAAAAHWSPWHFARTFRRVLGISVMSYVRRRRLTRAAAALRHCDTGVLQVALDCGFASNEAFTRAFRAQFGITPMAYRRNPYIQLPRQEPITMSDSPEHISLTPEIRRVPTFMVAGLASEFALGPAQHGEIGALWGAFVPRMAELRNVEGEETYGVSCLPGEGPRTPENFTYMAGMRVASLDGLPEGMIGVTIPESDYAVFSYDGGIGPELGRSMQYIFGEWLPNSGYVNEGPDFECYGAEFDPHSGSGRFYLYIPIRPAG